MFFAYMWTSLSMKFSGSFILVFVYLFFSWRLQEALLSSLPNLMREIRGENGLRVRYHRHLYPDKEVQMEFKTCAFCGTVCALDVVKRKSDFVYTGSSCQLLCQLILLGLDL